MYIFDIGIKFIKYSSYTRDNERSFGIIYYN